MITCWHCTSSMLDGTLFCDKCGAALLEGAPRRTAPPPEEPRLVLDDTGVAIPLPKGPAVVVGRTGDDGQAPDVDLAPFRAAAAGVSRAHLLIDLSGPLPRIKDLASTNGTYVNGRRLVAHHPVALARGDQISLGQMAVRLEM